MSMRLELVQFENTNRVLLPGLLYEPEIKTDKILIRLHGNGSSGGFYGVDNNNILGKKLTESGISYLTFTNIGGHLIQRFDQIINDGRSRILGGSAYELIKDCIYDIDGALNFVDFRGYKDIYLMGASTGANKIAVYNKYKPTNKIKKYILECGGDDAGSYYAPFGERKFNEVLEICKQKIARIQGLKLIPKKILNYPLSYQSLFDLINPEGDYNIFPFYWQLNNTVIMKKKPFGEVAKIDKPTLIVYGSEDEYCYGRVPDCVDLLKKVTAGKNNFRFEIIEGADHGFLGKWQELANKVVDFINY